MNTGWFKKAAVATAMATALVAVVGQGGAFADVVSDAIAVAGTGTITPGLPTTGCAVQTAVTFNGIGYVAGDEGVRPAVVNFDGDSGAFCETLNAGQGSGTLTGTFASAARGVGYVRTGPIVQVFGSVTYGVLTHVVLGAVCIFVPASVNPVQTYVLVCGVALSSIGD